MARKPYGIFRPLTQAQFGSRSLPDYWLLIHVHISQFTQFSLHLVSVVQDLDQQSIVVCPFTKTSIRGETSGGVACEQALCLGKGETESRGVCSPFIKQRACSQVSGGVAKCQLFSQATKIQVEKPGGWTLTVSRRGGFSSP